MDYLYEQMLINYMRLRPTSREVAFGLWVPLYGIVISGISQCCQGTPPLIKLFFFSLSCLISFLRFPTPSQFLNHLTSRNYYELNSIQKTSNFIIRSQSSIALSDTFYLLENNF